MNPEGSGSWWSRNWKRFAPSGCLGMVLIFAVSIFLIVSVVTTGMKSSDAYKESVSMVQNSPEAAAHLGVPLEPGWFITGKVTVTGGSGEADLAIPVSGPNGKGNLYVAAHKNAGQWSFENVVLVVEGKDVRIDLLDEVNQ